MSYQKIKSTLPILLLDGQDLPSVENALRMLKERRSVPLSLRELLLFRRGAGNVLQDACCLVILARSEREVSALLALLRETSVPIVLVCEELVSTKTRDALMRMPYITVIPSFASQKTVHADAMYSETVDTVSLREMRKRGVRVVITETGRMYGEIPFGMDILFASPVLKTAFYRTEAERAAHHGEANMLPLDPAPLFSALPLAIPLSILGTDEDALHRMLASGRWRASYTPTEDRYEVSAEFDAVRRTPCAMPQDVCDTFCGYLKDGFYIELRMKEPIAALGSADRLLLYGFDRALGTFAVQTALHHGMFERIDMLPQTLLNVCAAHGASVALLSLAKTDTLCDTETFVHQLQTRQDSCAGTYFGKEAAIRFANRFYSRFAEGDGVFCAASLRNFLEERERYGFAFWYLAKQEDLYLEPFENHLRLLADVCKPAIDDLRGKEWLLPEMPLYLTSELMRNILNAEEACTTAFLEDWDRALSRRQFLQTKTLQKR